VFERASELTRTVVLLAYAEAERRSREVVGTDDFLVAVLRGQRDSEEVEGERPEVTASANVLMESGDRAVAVLTAFGVRLDAVRRAVQRRGSETSEEVVPGGSFTKQLDCAFWSAARQRFHEDPVGRIDPSHVLAEIIRIPNAAAVTVLSEFGIDTRYLLRTLRSNGDHGS
jgi:ClpA/ClpB-like protein